MGLEEGTGKTQLDCEGRHGGEKSLQGESRARKWSLTAAP